MSDRTYIEWTDATWNPVSGCSKVSQGCKYCYAERMFHRPYLGRDFTDVRVHPDRLDQPLHWKKPRRIFVNSMSDLFHEKVSREFLKSVMGITVDCGQHTFQILTKRPKRMRDFCMSVGGFPPNVWLGVSIENQQTADERIPILLQTPAAIRFVSYEPALGPVDISRSLHVETIGGVELEPWINWVIAGGESGPRARPSHPDWFRSARDQCQEAGVPFFFKQWGCWRQGYSHNSNNVFLSRNPSMNGVGRVWVERVSKSVAGRLLDGREWNEFPA